MRKIFIASFAAFLAAGSYSFLFGQQAMRGNLRPRDMVVTNEVDPTVTAATNAMRAWVVDTRELHWDNFAGILWRSVYSNGYVVIFPVTNTAEVLEFNGGGK